jgi:hypothetical protein
VQTVVRVATLLLGAVFVVAGASKIVAGSTWIAQARQMGATQPIATVLPGVELVLGALLVVGIGGDLPVIAAIVLLVAFSVAIARQLVDGRHPPCACFGAWSQRPLSESHLWRNAGLILLGFIALWPA